MKIKRALAVGSALAAIYALWLLAVWPAGDFPINDDWAYAWSVKHLLDDGRFRLSDWASATSVVPVLWAAAFCKLADGFSFTTLRWSTIAASWAGCVGLYALLRESGLRGRPALLGAVALAVNPMYLALSYTFMSDVFFVALMTWSLALYGRGLRTRSGSFLLLGSVAAALSYLTRQLGVVLPISAVAVILLRDRRQGLRSAIQAAALPFVVFVIHTIWLNDVHGLPWGFALNAVHNSLATLVRPTKLADLGWRLLGSFLYLGLFASPVLAAALASRAKSSRPSSSFVQLAGRWLVVLTAFCTITVFVSHEPMPFFGNVISRLGFGPISLLGSKEPATPSWFFWVLTVLATVSGAVLAALWTEAATNIRRPDRTQSLAIASLLMAVMTGAVVSMSDEYLLVFIPASLTLVLRRWPITGRGFAVGAGICTAMLIYGCREMADYMAWNSARWAAGRELIREGVQPQDIDGGFEWAGWYEFESALPIAIAKGQGMDLFGWAKIYPHHFVLSFTPQPGYRVLWSVPYRSAPLGPEGQIYAQRREAN